MVKTQGLTHIHLVVRDLERSLQFYQGVFGMEERFRDGPKMVFLNTPDAIVTSVPDHLIVVDSRGAWRRARRPRNPSWLTPHNGSGFSCDRQR